MDDKSSKEVQSFVSNETSQDPREQLLNKAKSWFSSSLSVKALMIGFIILVLLIPQAMIMDLLNERQNRSREAISEITQTWGEEQVFHGPILSIPGTKTEIVSRDKRERKVKVKKYFHLYPDELRIDGNIDPEERARSIFKAILYQVDLKVRGHFNPQKILTAGAQEGYELHFDQAIISVGLSDVRGTKNRVVMNINGKDSIARPGIPLKNGLEKGFHFPVIMKGSETQFTFSSEIGLRGSSTLSFVPTGQNSEINLASSWKDPSFYGAFLPSERKVNKDGSGFSAKWQINDLQRGFRQQWKDGENRGEVVDCGVKLIQVTDVYKQVNRVVKYAVLFLCFTFAAIFISERITRRKLHPIQYLLVGFASLMFYVLLLSFSEQMDFNKAYILTAALTTLLLTTYAKGLFGEWKTSMVIGGVCTGLYSFLFGTIQLEDYALMMGSSGLFVILALVMFLTRKLNVQEEPLPG